LRLSFLPVLLAAGKWGLVHLSNFYLLVGRWLDDRSQGWAELAGGEGVEGAEAPGEFARGQLAVAEERAKKIVGAAWSFTGIAFQTARDEIAVGIQAHLSAWHNMVETLYGVSEPAQAIKAMPALPGMDGLAQGPGAQEILLFEVDGESGRNYGAGRDRLRMLSENL
jgi:hypothetical protein